MAYNTSKKSLVPARGTTTLPNVVVPLAGTRPQTEMTILPYQCDTLWHIMKYGKKVLARKAWYPQGAQVSANSCPLRVPGLILLQDFNLILCRFWKWCPLRIPGLTLLPC